MKRIGLFLSVAVIGTMLVASSAFAQEGTPDWANKAGAFGVGANTSLGGSNGVNFRTWITPLFGVQATLGMRFATGTTEVEDVDDSEVDFSMTAFDIGLYGLYKLAYWQRGSLSVIFGGDVQTYSESTDAAGDNDTDRSATNIVIGIGVQGEYFPTQYLSLFAQAGFVLDFLSDDDLECMRYDAPQCTAVSLPGSSDGYNLSGFAMGLGGDLWGAAGFTVWFK